MWVRIPIKTVCLSGRICRSSAGAPTRTPARAHPHRTTTGPVAARQLASRPHAPQLRQAHARPPACVPCVNDVASSIAGGWVPGGRFAGVGAHRGCGCACITGGCCCSAFCPSGATPTLMRRLLDSHHAGLPRGSARRNNAHIFRRLRHTHRHASGWHGSYKGV